MNPGVKAYLRSLATEFNESTNAVRVELNRLVDAKLLKVKQVGRNKFYSANIDHPLYPEIRSICHKTAGIGYITSFLNGLGKIKAAYIAGDYARGVDSGIIDLVVVGDVNRDSFFDLVQKTENLIDRKIRILLLKPDEEEKISLLKQNAILPIWTANGLNGNGGGMI